jgi:Zn-dependent alcohol dehydrogenase
LGKQFIPYLIDQHKKGDFPIEELITYYNIHDYEKAIKDFEDGKIIKAVLKW